MTEPKFNLLDEPWILVTHLDGKEGCLPLADVLTRSHEIKSLSGEMPAQDFAVLRLLLGVLYAIYTRTDKYVEAQEKPGGDTDKCIEIWKELWERGHFPECEIVPYFETHREGFWLLHPERPFYQVPEIKAKATYGVAKMIGELVESALDTLFFISSQQARKLAEIALGGKINKDVTDATIQALKEGRGLELALFGRMVATRPDLGVEASAQVAHAISTHRVENEYDYFTAVDDYTPEENIDAAEDHAGAGMIGTVEYNSATLYRYATVAVHELFANLSKDRAALEKAVKEFIRAFVLSMPTGKQNTFAAHTMPFAVMVALRPCRPLNLADAFEKPIPARQSEGFAKPSADALVMQAKRAYENFCAKPEACFVIGEELAELGTKVNLDELLELASEEATKKVVI